MAIYVIFARAIRTMIVTKEFTNVNKGAFNNYVEKMRGGKGQKMSVFFHAKATKTVHTGKGSKMAKFCPRSC